MKIENNNLSFRAKVESKFVNSAQNFYINRNLPNQYEAFQKKIEKFEYFGDENTEIVHKAVNNENGNMHLLCLKNENINKKKAIIIAQNKRYNEILRFFMKLNDTLIKEYEKYLSKI